MCWPVNAPANPAVTPNLSRAFQKVGRAEGGGEDSAKKRTGNKNKECPFYLKIGCCRHGTSCSRVHVIPTSARTILIAHAFEETPESFKLASEEDFTDEEFAKAQKTVEEFWVELFAHMAEFGEIEDLILVDNTSDHMTGNVYVQYYEEESGHRALAGLKDSYWSGRKLQAEFSPVIDFREARCRAFCEGRCPRGQECNFLHCKNVPRALRREAVMQMYRDHPQYETNRNSSGNPLVWVPDVKKQANYEMNPVARQAFQRRWWWHYEQNHHEDRMQPVTPPSATRADSPRTRTHAETGGEHPGGKAFPEGAVPGQRFFPTMAIPTMMGGGPQPPMAPPSMQAGMPMQAGIPMQAGHAGPPDAKRRRVSSFASDHSQ